MFDKDSFQWFLSKSITLYCKSVLPNSTFRVDVMIGVTVNDADVSTLICFSESIVKSENSLEAQDANPQVSMNDIKQTVGEDIATIKNSCKVESSQEEFDVASNNNERLNANSHQAIRKLDETCYSKSKMRPEVKHELQDASADAAGSEENEFDDDCYVEETGMDSGDVLPESYNQESWNEGDWNDVGYLPNRVSETKQARRPNKRNVVQRVKVNQEQIMSGRGMAAPPPPSSEYNNLMHDICTSMVNQSTEFSRRKNGIQGSLSSSSPVTCHICHATLSNTLCLRNHIQGTHLALKLKKCNLCGETFKWPMQLARHKKRVHGGGSYLNIYNT